MPIDPRNINAGLVRWTQLNVARCSSFVLYSTAMMEGYFPILLFIVVGLLVGSLSYVLGSLLGTKNPDPAKTSPYECGFEPFENARMKFDVRYYLVAILFIIFDLEIVFLFPWAVSLSKIGLVGFMGMAIFLLILVIGFLYEWRKGALEWE